jgi:NAD(P)-dependent dehydrogenase (short-subunit alcohol dehydrogenase family)
MMFKDKVIIISGIGPGMGVELARIAAREEAKIGISCRTESFLEQTEREIADEGGEVIAMRVDISKKEDCLAFAKKVIDTWGRIDALVNNAASIGTFEKFEDVDLDKWRQTFNINLFGTLQMAQACVPQMKAQKKGYIVNVSSMAFKKPLPLQGGYSASKAGLEGASKFMALELGKYGIRVNCARMGWMLGPPVTDFFEDKAAELGSMEAALAPIAQNIALGEIQNDADCARAVLALCTDWMASVTGAVLDINGGEFMP